MGRSGEVKKRKIRARPSSHRWAVSDALNNFDETAYSLTSVHTCGRIVKGNFLVWKLCLALKDSDKLRSKGSGKGVRDGSSELQTR